MQQWQEKFGKRVRPYQAARNSNVNVDVDDQIIELAKFTHDK